jgi:branched-chain amino acid transport system ATP-binding protein
VGYVPEDRQVFPGLTVRQNLELGLKRAGVFGRWKFDDVFTLFPNLGARQENPAGVLSGGEQQMLSLARALLGDPDLLLVDEPGEGLAGFVMQQVAQCLRVLRERGMAMLLIEQRLVIAQDIASRVAVMGHGEIVFDGELHAFLQRPDVMREWLGVG